MSQTEHDPLCPARCDFADPSPTFGSGSCRGGDCTRCDESDCFCDFIARVRANERREVALDTEAGIIPDGIRDVIEDEARCRIRKQVAGEIARAIETEARERQSTRLQAHTAAAIARRIGGAS